MTKFAKICLFISVFVGLSGAGVYAAVAQVTDTTTVTVNAGNPTVIAKLAAKPDVTVMPKNGTFRVDDAVPPPGFNLVYTANPTSEPATDTLSYTLEGDAQKTVHSIAITIKPAPTGFSPETYEQSFKSLFLLFVLAVILESGLAVIFNWRPFTDMLNARAVRPLVAFVVAWIFVGIYNLDITTTLVNAVSAAHYPIGVPGEILTALVIAGGSNGVNTMLVSLGFREVKTPQTVVPKPPSDKAWIAVRAKRDKAVGPLKVYIGLPIPAPDPKDPPTTTLVGTITGSSSKSLLAYFFADRGRFPNYGGHSVPPNQDVIVIVEGVDKNGARVVAVPPFGPVKLAAGAAVDIDVTV